MKKYCPSCGKQNPVSAKFCCHCGDSTSLVAKVKQKTNPLRGTSRAEEDDYEDDEDQPTQITATQLEVEIMPTWEGKETIGSLMQEGESGPAMSDGYEKEGGPIEINEKQFLEDFRKEAGPIRGDQAIGEQ